jgi:hypothetical protein
VALDVEAIDPVRYSWLPADLGILARSAHRPCHGGPSGDSRETRRYPVAVPIPSPARETGPSAGVDPLVRTSSSFAT